MGWTGRREKESGGRGGGRRRVCRLGKAELARVKSVGEREVKVGREKRIVRICG